MSRSRQKIRPRPVADKGCTNHSFAVFAERGKIWEAMNWTVLTRKEIGRKEIKELRTKHREFAEYIEERRKGSFVRVLRPNPSPAT